MRLIFCGGKNILFPPSPIAFRRGGKESDFTYLVTTEGLVVNVSDT